MNVIQLFITQPILASLLSRPHLITTSVRPFISQRYKTKTLFKLLSNSEHLLCRTHKDVCRLQLLANSNTAEYNQLDLRFAYQPYRNSRILLSRRSHRYLRRYKFRKSHLLSILQHFELCLRQYDSLGLLGSLAWARACYGRLL